MRITVKGKNIAVTPALRQYVEKKLSKLERYFENIDEAIATLSVEKERHIVEVTVPLNGGMLLRGEEETNDMYASVDLVMEKLERQIEKYKTKIARKMKDGKLLDLAAGQEKAAEEEPRLVRTKRFAMKPMPVEEAILQMNLLGHDFFVFSNAETEEVNVVYRRRDGNYGLIEPIF
ncbi:MAG: ribosome-associated translation inhibitor RaiA [bacterium]|jgi:putative sigma-54 modulation protein|nr:ribosome-associated translation inhibitor RaiA [Bacillota bacterium]HHW55640.1 ribosome-associated translation inhibitor RaiA [Bacillota bacterium]